MVIISATYSVQSHWLLSVSTLSTTLLKAKGKDATITTCILIPFVNNANVPYAIA